MEWRFADGPMVVRFLNFTWISKTPQSLKFGPKWQFVYFKFILASQVHCNGKDYRHVIVKRAEIGSKDGWKLSTIFKL